MRSLRLPRVDSDGIFSQTERLGAGLRQLCDVQPSLRDGCATPAWSGPASATLRSCSTADKLCPRSSHSWRYVHDQVVVATVPCVFALLDRCETANTFLSATFAASRCGHAPPI